MLVSLTMVVHFQLSLFIIVHECRIEIPFKVDVSFKMTNSILFIFIIFLGTRLLIIIVGVLFLWQQICYLRTCFWSSDCLPGGQFSSVFLPFLFWIFFCWFLFKHHFHMHSWVHMKFFGEKKFLQVFLVMFMLADLQLAHLEMARIHPSKSRNLFLSRQGRMKLLC